MNEEALEQQAAGPLQIYKDNEAYALDHATGELSPNKNYFRQQIQQVYIPYSQELGEFILEKLLEQRTMSLRSLTSTYSGLPSAAKVVRWLSDYPDFAQGYDDVLKARALYALENIEDIANSEHDKDEAAGVKINLDASKFLVERFDKRRFGSTPEKADSGVVINIMSGIQRDTEDGRDIRDVIQEIRDMPEEDRTHNLLSSGVIDGE